MRSMTGYGRAEYFNDGINLLVEIKTVNNRNFDLNTKIPRSFLMFEDNIRKVVQSYIIRGRIDLFINFIDKREKNEEVDVNLDKALAFYKAGEKIAKELSINNDLTVSSIIKMPDVISDSVFTDYSDLEEILIETVKKACENLNSMRLTEGEKLIADMLSRMDTIKDLRNKILLRAPNVACEYKEKLKARIVEALDGVNYDEARLLNEVAFYTDKVNIDEELTRLDSHIKQFCDTVKKADSGKKLDFLMQEFNREANTICSKSNDIEVTNLALSLKNEIEKVREQVQNLE